MARISYLSFRQNLLPMGVFSVGDAKKFYPNFDTRRLVEWQAKDYLRKITNGLYLFSEVSLEIGTLFWISNRISPVSYVSLESALSHYNLIPEGVFNVTAVTTGKPKRCEFGSHSFIFRSVRPDLFYGYRIISFQNWPVRFAEPEKALLDYFYLNASLCSAADFEALRINAENLKSALDRDKLAAYLQAFNNKSLSKRVANFLEFADA